MGRLSLITPPPVLIGVSRAMRQVLELSQAAARSDCCVLVEGESGTGKELVARRLHALGPRAAAPFIPVNCAGVSETLFESQFFGHERGAFTGAQQSMLGLVRSAAGGTLLLDEVGEIPLHIQPKFLRLLQDGEVLPVGATAPVRADARFIGATNCSLSEEVRRGRFRQDLYYRLNIVRIFLPPLRQRPEDVGPLLDHFLAAFAAEYRRLPIVVPEGVRNGLAAYSWPGNVRELASWVERLYVMESLPEALVDALADAADTPSEPAPEEIKSLRQTEREAIRRALHATGHNQLQAARLLDIHRTTLARKLREPEVA
jgi:DNA-binding NtrC family response regulator